MRGRPQAAPHDRRQLPLVGYTGGKTSSLQFSGALESWPVLFMKLAVRIRPSGRVVHFSALVLAPGVFAASHCLNCRHVVLPPASADSFRDTRVWFFLIRLFRAMICL